jgi:hypothetical protein
MAVCAFSGTLATDSLGAGAGTDVGRSDGASDPARATAMNNSERVQRRAEFMMTTTPH